MVYGVVDRGRGVVVDVVTVMVTVAAVLVRPPSVAV